MEKTLVCPYCGVGCRIVVVKGSARGYGSISGGLLCANGLRYVSFTRSARRLKKPLVRVGGALREASWSEALERAALMLTDAARSAGGWDAIGFIGGSKLFNEEAYALQKLARALGSPHIDTCSRLCHYPSLLAQLSTLGFGGLTAPYSELLDSQAVLLLGWNGAITAPVLFARYVLGAKKRGARVVAVDVWKSETVKASDLWLRVKPRGDGYLLVALARLLADRGVAPEARSNVENLDEVLGFLAEVDPEHYARIAGSDPSTVEEAARLLDVERGSVLWGMGLTQHVNPLPAIHWAIIVAALRGWLWRRGCVVGGVRGQSNVQGVNDMGVLPEFLPGYRRVDDEDARRLYSSVAGFEPPGSPGYGETMMLEEAGREIRGLVIFAENTGVSHPQGSKSLERLSALVVVDAVLTPTAELADVVLPAATWGEKEGSATNAEGRVQWSWAVREPPGDARPDLAIVRAMAERLGVGRLIEYGSPWEVHPEIERLVGGYQGFSRALRSRGEHLKPRRVGRVRLKAVKPPRPVEARSGEKIIVTVRGLDYCSGAMGVSRAGIEARSGVQEESGVSMLETGAGSTIARVVYDPGVPKDLLIVEWHSGLNTVVPRTLDPETGMVELKAVWGRVKR